MALYASSARGRAGGCVARREVAIAAARIAAWLLVLLVGGALSLVVPGATIFFLIGPGAARLLAGDPRGPAAILMGCGAGPAGHVRGVSGLARNAACRTAPCARLRRSPRSAPCLSWSCGASAPAAAPSSQRLGVAASLWVAALTLPRSSADRPHAFTLDYVRDDVDKRRSGRSQANRLRFPPLGSLRARGSAAILPYSGRTRWLAAAPMIEHPLGDHHQARRNEPRQGRIMFGSSWWSGGADALALASTKRCRSWQLACLVGCG